jgi:hypothetical protein
MARGVSGSGRTYTFRSPVTGEIVSQGQYRRELAAARGTTRYQRVKEIAAVKRELAPNLAGLSARQAGILAAAIVDYRGRIGRFVIGQRVDRRGSSTLPPQIVTLIRSLGANQYPVWRLLYR